MTLIKAWSMYCSHGVAWHIDVSYQPTRPGWSTWDTLRCSDIHLVLWDGEITKIIGIPIIQLCRSISVVEVWKTSSSEPTSTKPWRASIFPKVLSPGERMAVQSGQLVWVVGVLNIECYPWKLNFFSAMGIFGVHVGFWGWFRVNWLVGCQLTWFWSSHLPDGFGPPRCSMFDGYHGSKILSEANVDAHVASIALDP